jgi:glycosyltransferase involved in cell wall biosynthesis
MVSNKPLFTVLLPVYNAEAYLRKAVDSVLCQTLPNFEFLIIDDGSTDASRSILDEYARKDKRIRLISRPNKGFVETLKEGTTEARADLIARMDADDIALPNRFELQYKFLDSHKAYGIVGCQIRPIDLEGEQGVIDPRPTTDTNLKLFLAYGCALSGPTVMYRKKLIQDVGGFKKSAWPAEDYDCWVRLLETRPQAKIYNLPEVLYLYRSTPDGISFTNKVSQIQKTIDMGNRHRAALIAGRQSFLSEEIHKGWFADIEHIPDPEAREQLKRIYFTIQAWLRNDVAKSNRFKSYILKLRLVRLTKKYNPENLPYVYNQEKSHSFPAE